MFGYINKALKICGVIKKRVGKREDDSSSLPVETVTHELPEAQQSCAECGEQLHFMGREIRKELVIIPAQVKVKEYIRHVIVRRHARVCPSLKRYAGAGY